MYLQSIHITRLVSRLITVKSLQSEWRITELFSAECGTSLNSSRVATAELNVYPYIIPELGTFGRVETLHKIFYTCSWIIIMVIRKVRKWQYFSGGQRLVSSCGTAAGAVNVYTTCAVWTVAAHQIRILHNNLLTSQHSIFQSIWEFSYSTDLSYGAGLGNMQQSI